VHWLLSYLLLGGYREKRAPNNSFTTHQSAIAIQRVKFMREAVDIGLAFSVNLAACFELGGLQAAPGQL
jgi:hypothetical protein